MIKDFLKTERSKGDLRIALDVLREFKSYDGPDNEWRRAFASLYWVKLDQLERYLEHLVEGKPLV